MKMEQMQTAQLKMQQSIDGIMDKLQQKHQNQVGDFASNSLSEVNQTAKAVLSSGLNLLKIGKGKTNISSLNLLKIGKGKDKEQK